MNSIPLDEQETIINISPKKVDEKADVYSSDPVIIRKLEKLTKGSRNEVMLEKKDDISIQVRVPRNWIKIAPPRRVNMTEEQRRLAAERLRTAREGKKN